MKKIDLSGIWGFCPDRQKEGIEGEYFKEDFKDTIPLPGTVSTAKKRELPSLSVVETRNVSSLTDPYSFEGYTWYSKILDLSELNQGEYFLVLERTRVSHVWIGKEYLGSNNSLCTSHRYRITPYAGEQIKLTLMIDNTGYPIKGGHMTSPDTQTNWNGVTGDIYIEEVGRTYLDKIKIYPDAANKLIQVKVSLNGAAVGRVEALVAGGEDAYPTREYLLKEGENTFIYQMDENAKTWSEHSPYLYYLKIKLKEEAVEAEETDEIKEADEVKEADKAEETDITGRNEYDISFGLRDFKAAGHYFEVNGRRTFLRGKHDGLIFPLTGHAPTDLQSWLKVLGTAKEYGINHYRFHTCCPPEACFEAADIVGIYLEPELPFWGTVTGEGDENHDEEANRYLIEEGFHILDEFGNHPSFVMMSLGNELWGNKEVLNDILKNYKAYDNRHLFTQGSNNFQFTPCVLEEEDFFCGVRLSAHRLFRGSYAMCDAPLGHIQTMAPDTIYNYDSLIRPKEIENNLGGSGEILIQYGTGMKKVKMDVNREMIPEVPVVSHEIGQYAMYPDFSEIEKYTGVLKADNLQVMKERLAEKGMLHMAEGFFKASGRFAAECYKAEIETALRSRELAGFQLLDLQDFSGQGTALVGILNAFMENKGVISQKEWRQFCSAAVILAELPGFVFSCADALEVGIKLAAFCQEAILSPKVRISLWEDREKLYDNEKSIPGSYSDGVYELCQFSINIPEVLKPSKLQLKVEIAGTDIENDYDIWVYPLIEREDLKSDSDGIIVTDSVSEAITHLEKGRKVILYLTELDESNSIQGTYCTDFWCYPMFRSISESMGKPIPVGTHGLYIEKDHEIFKEFPVEMGTSAQWYDMVEDSRSLILDGWNINPIVWTIDNFERNHKLGNFFEVRVGEGKLLVSTFNLHKLKKCLPAVWLEHSMIRYLNSESFQPGNEMSPDMLLEMLRGKLQ